MKNDDFGDRMKQYERAYTDVRIPIDVPLCVRIDGKGFSKFTKGFAKPFDQALTRSMVDTTKALVKETNASIGYTQSDEITLIWVRRSEKQSEHIYGGKVSKINSILASMAAATFNYYIAKYAPTTYAGKGLAYFDCRAWSVPDEVEASNVLLWRIQDAEKNSISSLYRWTLGHSKMQGLSGRDMIEQLRVHSGVHWEDVPETFRYGSIINKKAVQTKLSNSTLAKIPNDKKPKEGYITRNIFVENSAKLFREEMLENRIKAVLPPC